jgi:hypothetical protein
MFDKALTIKMIRNKFYSLMVSFLIGLGIAFILWLVMSLGASAWLADNALPMSPILILVAVHLAISLFVYLWIQAYTDYYDHFPMAIATGKTRRQFLLSTLISSLIVTAAGALVIVALLNLQIYVYGDMWRKFLPEELPPMILRSAPTLSLSLLLYYLSSALGLTLWAGANYRFGAKIWLVPVVFIILSSMQAFTLFDSLSTLLKPFCLSYWTTKFFGERVGEMIKDTIHVLVVSGLITWLTLRLEPMDKEKLS